MSLTNDLDQMDLCRICLVMEQVGIHIFEVETDESETPQLLTKINVCLPIKVSKDDKLPKKICMDCFCKVESFYQFYNISAQAEQQLLSWLDKDNLNESQVSTGGESMAVDYLNVQLGQDNPEESTTEYEALTDETRGKVDNEEFTAEDCVQKEETLPDKMEQDDFDYYNDRNSTDNQDHENNHDNQDEQPLALRISSLQGNKAAIESESVITEKLAREDRRVRWSSELKWHLNRIRGRIFCKVLSEKQGREKYGCTECEEKFIRKENAKAHFREVHIDAVHYECKCCDREFKSFKTFKLHRTVYAADESVLKKVFYCDKCDYRSERHQLFRAHVAKKHGDVYKYDCDICGKKFLVKRSIRDHMMIHDDSTHKCDVCGRFLPNARALYQHVQKNHTHMRNFKCLICNFKCTSQKFLDEHVKKLHDPDKPHVCKECGQEFRIRRYLSRHVRRCHEGSAKKHLCSVCGKAFLDIKIYQLHCLTHANIRPYECNVCGETFTQRVTMMTHWKRRHPDATEPPAQVSLSAIFKTLQEEGLIK